MEWFLVVWRKWNQRHVGVVVDLLGKAVIGIFACFAKTETRTAGRERHASFPLHHIKRKECNLKANPGGDDIV